MTYIPDIVTGIGPLAEQKASNKNLQLYVTPSWGNGESSLRVETTETGSATVTVDNNSEWNLNTTASGTDDCKLESFEAVRVYPSLVNEIGISMRLPDALTGNQFAEWGIDDDDTGAGFGRDSTGYYVWVRHGGTQTTVAQSSWNVDAVGGLGPSGLSLNAATCTRFVIEYDSFYTGLINFYILLWDTSTYLMEKVLVHRWAPTIGAVDSVPVGPIVVRLDNDGTATGRDIFCQEFWAASYGNIPAPMQRFHNQFQFNYTPGTTPIPTVSFRRKTGFNKYGGVKCYVGGFDLSTTDDLLVYIRTAATLSGASWANGQTPANETVLEVDISATGTNSGSNKFIGVYGAGNHIVNFLEWPRIYLPRDDTPISLYIRTLTGTATRVDVLFRMVEEW